MTKVFRNLDNESTLKCIVRINNPDTRVYFENTHSLKDLLGFEENFVGVGEHEWSKIVNILRVNSLFVNCYIITGSYVSSYQKPVLYSFFPNVPPGYKIIESVGSQIYLPISQNYIDNIRVWLTDQDGNEVNLRGVTLNIWLIIKSSW